MHSLFATLSGQTLLKRDKHEYWTTCTLLSRVNQDRVCQAQKVLRALQDLLGSQERRVVLDYLVFLEKMVKQDLQDLRE